MPTHSAKETGVDAQIWAARSIAQVFEKLHLPFDELKKQILHHLLKIFNHPHPIVQRLHVQER